MGLFDPPVFHIHKGEKDRKKFEEILRGDSKENVSTSQRGKRVMAEV